MPENLFTKSKPYVNSYWASSLDSRVEQQAAYSFPNSPTPDGNLSSDRANGFGEVPTRIKGAISGWGQPMNLSVVYDDVQKLQSAIRQAERGDTYQLTTLYRDLVLGDSHIQAEFSKRKLVVVGQAWSIQPIDKTNAEDVKAAEAIKLMMEGCENWDGALNHLMDATLWPVAVAEKIYEPAQPGDMFWKAGLRLKLKQLFPVNPVLFCYTLPYLAQGGSLLPAIPGMVPPSAVPVSRSDVSNPALDTVYDPDTWEPTLRFYRTFPNGMVDRSWKNIYAPDPIRHVVHRGNTFTGFWDNYGGPMRSLIFWWFLGIQGRDWWARNMDRYGSPFICVFANAQQSDTFRQIEAALGMAGKLNAAALPANARVEMKETNTSAMGEAFENFLQFRNDECSKVILGQSGSAGQKKGNPIGGDAQANVLAAVRDDIAMFDKKMMNTTLRKQVFEPFLRLNGLTGRAPNMFFGGISQKDLMMECQALSTLFTAGIRVKESSLPVLAEKAGYELEYAPDPKPPQDGRNKVNQPKPAKAE